MQQHTITISEEQRQAMLLALAHLAVERPGWDYMLAEIALKMDNPMVNASDKPELYGQFKDLHAAHIAGLKP